MLNIDEIMMRHTVPVIINVFNQMTYLEQMVNSLEKHGFRSITVIDQASSHGPHNDYLNRLHISNRASVIRLPDNYGPHWFYVSETFNSMPSPMIYTDPDLAFPDRLDDEFCMKLYKATQKYKVAKAGCALDISQPDLFKTDRQEKFGQELTIVGWEKKFWEKEIEENVYDAGIDTTFHMFNRDFYQRKEFYRAVRFAGDGFTMKHLPWYKDSIVPAEEAEFYRQHTKHSSWF